MCYAILRVRYRGENAKTGEVVEVERQADLESKLAEIKTRSQAIAVSVFVCSRRTELVAEWVEKPYLEPQEPAS